MAIKVPNTKENEKVLIKELILGNFVKETLRELTGSANVVRYLGFEHFNGDYVMVMEYVAGGSLMDVLGSPGHGRMMPLQSALDITQGVLAGLTAIHQVGVFHRDIKPANILLDADIPKIGDLGIATMLHSHQQANTAIGTLAYMSPETLGSGGASFPSDIWSVGVMLYEMLTGCWPFGNEETPLLPMMRLIIDTEPVAPSDVRPEIPPWLDRIVLKALRKDPQERYSTPEDMRKALLAKDVLSDRLAGIRKLMMSPETGGPAESALRSLAEEFPDAARVYQYLGEVYNRTYRHAEAVDAFKRAIELEPRNALLHWDLALAFQKVGKTRYAAHSLERAIKLGLDPSLQRHATNLLHVLTEGLG